MRWRGAKVLSSTCPANTAVSSSSRSPNRGTRLSISGLHAIGHLWQIGWSSSQDCINPVCATARVSYGEIRLLSREDLFTLCHRLYTTSEQRLERKSLPSQRQVAMPS